MKTKLLVGAALAAVFAASGASAQTLLGWYGAIDAGAHYPLDIAAGNANAQYNSKWQDYSGWTADGRLGYQFTPHWRVEAEIGYRNSSFKGINTNLGQLPGTSGSIDETSYMGHVIYDFMPDAGIHPFLGLGAGAQTVNFNTTANLPYAAGGATFTSNSSDTEFAWQGLAGLAFKVSDHWNVDLTYRYTGGEKSNWNTTTVGGAGPGAFNG